jgi:hypothetical protein
VVASIKNIANFTTHPKSTGMTYNEYYQKARQEFAEKSDAFLKLDGMIRQLNGFGDMVTMARYNRAKNDWQNAANTYFTFQDFWALHGATLNPDDVMYE